MVRRVVEGRAVAQRRARLVGRALVAGRARPAGRRPLLRLPVRVVAVAALLRVRVLLGLRPVLSAGAELVQLPVLVVVVVSAQRVEGTSKQAQGALTLLLRTHCFVTQAENNQKNSPK